MNFLCQKDSISNLVDLANSDRHSILIEGPTGCGKTYLSKYYSKLLNVSDFQIIDPTVQSIRSAIETCLKMNTDIVLCIENLDKGVLAASYTLLKFLEEPTSHVYLVITCRNINFVPDTIISRSTVVSVSPPHNTDIEFYAKYVNIDKYNELNSNNIWKCIKTFTDVDEVFNLTTQQLDYFNSISNIMNFRDSVSNIVWKLAHYPDNSETPIELIIKYIVANSSNTTVIRSGINCIDELSDSRISKHAILSNFVFDAVYLE